MTARAIVVRLLIPAYLIVIFGAAGAAAIFPVLISTSLLGDAVAIATAPATFVVVMLLSAGSLSRLTLSSILEGRYPRSLGHAVYGPRRLYALCWTSVYYCSPVYHAMLTVPILRKLTFRLFGYRGNLDFTTYPDSWLRDLPLLDFGEGAYISNKATVSPNMCLRNGNIVVLPVRVGARSMVGHMTMLAPGVRIGDDVEIGVGCGIGLKVTVDSRSIVGHHCLLDHGVTIGRNCRLGIHAYIGRGTFLGNDLKVPSGAVIPQKLILRTQAQVDALCGPPRLSVGTEDDADAA